MKTTGGLKSRFVWVVYISLGLCLTYSMFYLASYFGASFFVLSHRGMVEHTVTGSLVSSAFDLAIWGSSILVISAWFFYSLFSRKREWLAFITMALCCFSYFGGAGCLGGISFCRFVQSSVFRFSQRLDYFAVFGGFHGNFWSYAFQIVFAFSF